MHEKIKEQIKDAMRAKDELRKEVLRGILTAFVNELVAKRRTPQEILGDDDCVAVLKRLVKQRKDSAEQFTSGGRPELAEKELKELAIIEEFLPALMPREEIKKIALAKKAELGAVDKSSMGKFIGAVMKECKGKADGKAAKGRGKGKTADGAAAVQGEPAADEVGENEGPILGVFPERLAEGPGPLGMQCKSPDCPRRRELAAVDGLTAGGLDQ